MIRIPFLGINIISGAFMKMFPILKIFVLQNRYRITGSSQVSYSFSMDVLSALVLTFARQKTFITRSDAIHFFIVSFLKSKDLRIFLTFFNQMWDIVCPEFVGFKHNQVVFIGCPINIV